LLKRLVPTSVLVFLDSLAQLSGNWWQVTPSVFTRSQAIGETSLAVEGSFFQCPACGNGPLYQDGERLPCSGCGRQWSFHDGIYDFRDYNFSTTQK
jgi:hypothetical protein